jgi:hypothetical protein
MKTIAFVALYTTLAFCFPTASLGSHLICTFGGSEHCAFGVVPILASPSSGDCGGGPEWNNLEWRMVAVRCEDGVANPGAPPGGAGGNPCCQTSEHSQWRNEFSGDACQPFAAVYDECDPNPEPPTCWGPTNNLGSCIGDPVDVTTGNLEQSATDLDLGQGLAFSRHYSGDQEAIGSPPLGPSWRHSLDWRLVFSEAQQTGISDPDVQTALVWRPLGGSDLFVRYTSQITGLAAPWTGGTRANGGLAGDPTSEFVYTDGDGTRVTFDGATRALEKI